MRITRSLVPGCVGLALLAIASCSEESPGSAVQQKPPDATTGGTGSVIEVGGRSGGAGVSGAAGAAGAADPGPAPEECDEFTGLQDCGAMTLGAELETVNVLLVIDKSGSMTDTPEGFDENKWDSLVVALEQVLTDAAPMLNLGLLMYPYSRQITIPERNCGSNCCLLETSGAAINVPVAAGTDTAERILSLLADTPPGGGTPTAAALNHAREYLTGDAASELGGRTYVLLATDGGPNCNYELECGADRCTANLDDQCSLPNCCDGNGEFCVDDEAVSREIERLNEAGIPTFVVGIPGTEDYATYLDQFAEAGGVPNGDAPPSYYAVSAGGGVEGLIDVFEDITDLLVRSCEIELEREPPRPNLVNVAVDCEPIRQSEPDGSGWELDTSSSPGVITLSGPICTEIQTDGARRVDVVFGCQTVE